MADQPLLPADLGIYLGLGSDLDMARAVMCLNEANALALSITNPLPTGANAVILDVAARAYLNPGSLTSQTATPFAQGFSNGAGGLYLTRTNKRTLRRLAGGGGAFSIDTTPTGVSSVQTITLTGSPTGGSFVISTAQGQTVPIMWNDTVTTVQADFNALPSLGGTIVTGTPGAWVVTFPAAMGPFPQIGVYSTALTGGTSPGVQVGTITVGVYPPGANLPWWDLSASQPVDGVGWPLGTP